MKKSQIISYSTVLLASALIFGCSTADRVEEKANIANNPQDQIPNNGGNFINDDNNKTSNNIGGTFDEEEDSNSTTGTIKIDAKNAYKVAVTFSDDYNTKGYYSKSEVGELKFNITNIYTKEAADTDIIENITLEAEEKDETNEAQGKYLNFITFDGKQGGTYSINDNYIKAKDSVAIKMEKLSGTTNIILSVKIKDIAKPFKLKVPIVIEKNKSSSMAIVPIGSRYENGLYIDKFVIHVVDSYGNKAQDGTNISTGVINNPKLYSNAYNGAVKTRAQKYTVDLTAGESQTWIDTNLTDQELPNNGGKIISYDYAKYSNSITVPMVDENGTILKDENNNTRFHTSYFSSYYPSIHSVKHKNDKGTLHKSDGTFTINPADSTDIITDKISSLDTLIVLANKDNHHPENLGGWDIASVEGTNKLKLVSLDKGTDLSGISYVIGDEYRYIDRGQTIANGAVSTFETTEVKDGLAFAELRYTPELVGHNVFIYANTRLEDKHIGISRNVLLHGTGLSEQTMSCTNDKGTKPDCTMSYLITLNDSGKGAYKVNIGRPQIAGENTYKYATASRTSATGWTTVSIYGIDENKTATVKFGNLINDEYILNQK